MRRKRPRQESVVAAGKSLHVLLFPIIAASLRMEGAKINLIYGPQFKLTGSEQNPGEVMQKLLS